MTPDQEHAGLQVDSAAVALKPEVRVKSLTSGSWENIEA